MGMPTTNSSIRRHKTAIVRGEYSAPVRSALSDGLIGTTVTVLDYGCGRGGDVDRLSAAGVTCDGWDPVYRPDVRLDEADVVNLGFVINVIEDPAERAATLRRAWGLARNVLVVAAQVRVPARGCGYAEFGDGVVTSRGTFQKYFEQGELREYLEAELGTEPIPATVGIFYVFKREELRQQFLADRFRRRPAAPRVPPSERRFEEQRGILEPFMEALALYGRVPDPDEYPDADSLRTTFGSLARAFALVRRVTGEETWERIARRRREDLLVFLALARFRRRPLLSGLPATLQRDIRAFFGTYTRACREADELLFRAGDAEAVDAACRRSALGKLLPNALYVHRTALDSLDPLLRVFEGCAWAYLGEVEGASVVKLHRFSGKVSYLVYPEFDTVPHPALARSVKLSLRTRELYSQDYSASENPPVLHRKETFLAADHPLREKFARLTRQEVAAGLLDETATIGTRRGWEDRLSECGYRLAGHRLLRVKAGGNGGRQPAATTTGQQTERATQTPK